MTKYWRGRGTFSPLNMTIFKKPPCTTKYGGGEFDFGGVTEIPVDEVEDVAKLAKTIMNERKATSTNVNDSSSRSHCIATLNLICVKDGNAGKEVRRNSFTEKKKRN